MVHAALVEFNLQHIQLNLKYNFVEETLPLFDKDSRTSTETLNLKYDMSIAYALTFRSNDSGRSFRSLHREYRSHKIALNKFHSALRIKKLEHVK